MMTVHGLYIMHYVIAVVLYLVSAGDVSRGKPSRRTDVLFKALYHNHSNSTRIQECSFNIPTSINDQLPQQLRQGIGYQLIKLIESEFESEINVLKSVVVFIDFIVKGIVQSSMLRTTHDSEHILESTVTHLVKTLKPIDYITIAWTATSDSYSFFRSYDKHKQLFKRKVEIEYNILDNFSLRDAKEFIRRNKGQFNGWWFGPSLCTLNPYTMVYLMTFGESGLLLCYFNVSNVDIDQCNENKPFGITNKCPLGTKCNFIANRGFNLGAYVCVCSNHLRQQINFSGLALEIKSYYQQSLPKCQFVCSVEDDLCTLVVNKKMRLAMIVTQITFVLITMLVASFVFYHRDNKVIRSYLWKVLVITSIGCALVYSSVIMQAMNPSPLTCILQSWLREVGFVIVYGTVMLRLYKLLVEFQSRKARSIHLKENDLLQYLVVIICIVSVYLLAWTLVNLDHSKDVKIEYNFLFEGKTKSGERFIICQPRLWNYLAEILEFLFLCVILHLLYCTKTAPSSYNSKRKAIAIGVYLEIVVSVACNLLRFALWRTTNPDIVLMLYFVRCHLTMTMSILIDFYLKIFIQLCSTKKERKVRYQSSIDPTDTEFSALRFCSSGEPITISEMDSDDIKVELKRLYNLIHTLRLQNMRQANPHLPRKPTLKRKHGRVSEQSSFLRRHDTGISEMNSATTGNIEQSAKSNADSVSDLMTKNDSKCTNDTDK
ncbi:hypothetical protein GJ496_000947 [Pomphorhynchus laevis]|nr:hypothetical protein GJ496_000947 [Pomphorhynchus laevis]